MGEENTPRVTNPLVELDGTLSGLSLEVGGDGTKTETVVYFISKSSIIAS